MRSATTKSVTEAVLKERRRQKRLFPGQSLPDGTGAAGDWSRQLEAKHACKVAVQSKSLTWRDVLKEEYMEALAESDPDKLEAELTQVAAVAMAWIEDIRRRNR